MAKMYRQHRNTIEMLDLNNKQKTYWDNASDYIYGLYNTKNAGKYVLSKVIKSIERLTTISRELRILEIGCSAGTTILELADKGFKNLFGVDFSTNAINQAKKNAQNRGHKVNLFCGNATEMNMFKNKSFDIIFSAGVMEHIPDLKTALTEQYRILRKGGYIYVQVPNKYCPWHMIGKKIRGIISKKKHFSMPPVFRTFSRQEVSKFLHDAGFLDLKNEIIGSVIPQCPDSLFPINRAIENTIDKIPGLKNIQAFTCVSGRKLS